MAECFLQKVVLEILLDEVCILDWILSIKELSWFERNLKSYRNIRHM